MIQLLVDQYDDLDTMTRDMTVVMKLSPNGILRVDKEVHYKHATSLTNTKKGQTQKRPRVHGAQHPIREPHPRPPVP